MLFLEAGSKQLEVYGETASDQLKLGLHTLWPFVRLWNMQAKGCPVPGLGGLRGDSTFASVPALRHPAFGDERPDILFTHIRHLLIGDC